MVLVCPAMFIKTWLSSVLEPRTLTQNWAQYNLGIFTWFLWDVTVSGPEECYHWRSDLVNGGEIGEIHDKYFFLITDFQTSLAFDDCGDDETINRRSLSHSLLWLSVGVSCLS